eukprot:TRINITY_DN6653_c0_g1_i1.p1 TRINITY_DN6653_c0_g1~~TRINITY_DN6653_c0_g1_i1.p1  ORF type:complete len:641 (-),score=118.71 TRINITY_DN6653_c0_g1_i1:33-1955(-)
MGRRPAGTCILALTSWASIQSSAQDGAERLQADELACPLERSEWKEYHLAFDAAARATATDDTDDRASAAAELARHLRARTENVTDVLSCNVGVIAGYYLLARLLAPAAVESMGLAGGAPEGEAGLAYRLLQLALVFIFTLRNANRIPDGPGRAWGVTEQAIIPAIMQMRKGQDLLLHQRLLQQVPIAPSFRDPNLRIAVVSICAYPEDHPLALPRLTPSNREAYTLRHDYALRLHMEPPVIGAHGLGVQHAKLATVLAYLQSNEFDWVAWFDCDSILMNLDRTLDSIIYQYAQRKADKPGDAPVAPVCGQQAPSDSEVALLAGTWLDSWVPSEQREASAVQISPAEADGDVEASARQIGHVQGRLRGDDLELDFQDGTLRAHVVWREATEGSDRPLAERLEWENGAVWLRKDSEDQPPGEPPVCREPCREPGPGCEADLLDPEVNLLITEEGWGLSSANWLIRRSAWSIDFLHDALTAAHVEMHLFGDQDAMILHLMNRQSLEAAEVAPPGRPHDDPIDRHAVIVPQFELNAYDSLNALTMDCDAFVEGDLLVTFPQCKDAEGCNDVFELAAEYAKDTEKSLHQDAGAWWLRRETTPQWSRYTARSSPALRVFGPRPVIREVFAREQEMRAQDAKHDRS